MNSCARSHSTPPKCCILCDAYRALLNEICKSSEFLRWFCVFGIETEKLGLEVGNGLPSWKFNDQLFPCDVCGKVFGRQQTLSRHLSLHTGKAGLTWGCCSTREFHGVCFRGKKDGKERSVWAILGSPRAEPSTGTGRNVRVDLGSEHFFLCSLCEISPYKTCQFQFVEVPAHQAVNTNW